jgi:hypothetical protein
LAYRGCCHLPTGNAAVPTIQTVLAMDVSFPCHRDGELDDHAPQ